MNLKAVVMGSSLISTLSEPPSLCPDVFMQEDLVLSWQLMCDDGSNLMFMIQLINAPILGQTLYVAQ
jgi:hypothetical protein